MIGLVPAIHAAAPQGSVDLLAETLRSEAFSDNSLLAICVERVDGWDKPG
jgi:hypothetical protein